MHPFTGTLKLSIWNIVMKIRTIRCHEISEDINTVTLDEAELSAPAHDEVQVKLMACAVNFPDILMIQGKYQFAPPLPFAPGGEAAGIVVAVGNDIDDISAGDRLFWVFATAVLRKWSTHLGKHYRKFPTDFPLKKLLHTKQPI